MSGSTGSLRAKLSWPQMPHMVLVQRSKIRNQKSEGNRNFRNKKQEPKHQVSGEFQRSEITNPGGQTYCSVEYVRITMQIKSAKDLTSLQKSLRTGDGDFPMRVNISPTEERYSLTDQLRRSSKSVCSNLREAWTKRRYEARFVSKLTDSDGENGETETWLDFAYDCQYLPKHDYALFTEKCREVGAMLGKMINDPSSFILKSSSSDR